MPRVTAFINEGRQLVNCPACNEAALIAGRKKIVCGSAPEDIVNMRGRLLHRKGERVGDNGCGETLIVDYATNHEHALQVLAGRPNPRNRNWFPPGTEQYGGLPEGETVDKLVQENLAHNVPLVVVDAPEARTP